MLKLDWLMVRRFHDVAIRHYESAMYLLGGCSPNAKSAQATEVIYLGGYAVECILKGLFLSRFKPRKHASIEVMLISEVGHDLDLLRKKLVELKKKPIIMPPTLERSLRSVRSQWHPNLRYNAKFTMTRAATDFMELVDAIVRWAMKEA